MAAGYVCLVLGIIGAFFPIMPTTPFVLLAGACFASANPKMYERLKQAPLVGPFISHYSLNTGVSLRTKIGSIAFLWAGLIASMLIVSKLWVIVVLCLTGITVSAHIALLKAKPKDQADTPDL